MNLSSYPPTELLRPFVKAYLVIESQQDLVNRLLPDTSLVVAFRYKGQVHSIADASQTSLPVVVVSGLRRSARLVGYTGNTGNILVLFREAGAAAFFKQPLHGLFDDSVSLDAFNPRYNSALIAEQVAEAQNNQQRIALVERFLLSMFGASTLDKLVLAALQKIQAANGLVRIKELADSLYISQDAFEKRFRKTVGTSPKQFSSIVRMKSIIHNRPQSHTLFDLAFEAGYFDQAHFNKVFKGFTGQTPTDFFKSPSSW